MSAQSEPRKPSTMVPEEELLEHDLEEERRRKQKWDPNLGATIGESPDFERARRPAKPERMS